MCVKKEAGDSDTEQQKWFLLKAEEYESWEERGSIIEAKTVWLIHSF